MNPKNGLWSQGETCWCKPLNIQQQWLHQPPNHSIHGQLGNPVETGSQPDLVGGWATPLKNMSQLGWWNSQYMDKKNVPNHQPEIYYASKGSWWTFECILSLHPKGWLHMLMVKFGHFHHITYLNISWSLDSNFHQAFAQFFAQLGFASDIQ